MGDVTNGQHTPSKCATDVSQPYLTWCNVTCNVGYAQINHNNSRQCQADKTWSHQDEPLRCTR